MVYGDRIYIYRWLIVAVRQGWCVPLCVMQLVCAGGDYLLFIPFLDFTSLSCLILERVFLEGLFLSVGMYV